MQSSNSQSQVIDLLIKVHLSEYEALRNQMLKIDEGAGQIQLYAILGLAGLIPLVTGIQQLAAPLRSDLYVLYLPAALLFLAMGWYQLALDNRFVEIDNYVLQVLAPKLEALLSQDPTSKETTAKAGALLEWHRYWRQNQFGNLRGEWLLLGEAGRASVVLLGALFLLGTYIYFAHIQPALPLSLLSAVLVVIILFGAIWIIISALLIRRKYLLPTPKPR